MKKCFIVLVMAFCMLLSGCGIVSDLIGLGHKEIDVGSYDNVVDIWKENKVTQKEAKDQALKKLFEAAEKGDKELLAKNFTKKARESATFNSCISLFFKSYPKGLADCKMEYKAGGAGGSVRDGAAIKSIAALYRCDMNGTQYWIILDFTYQHSTDPDQLGIEHFSIMDLEGRAENIVDTNEQQKRNDHYEYEKTVPLACLIKKGTGIQARLINGSPYLWTETDSPKLSEDEMRKILNENKEKGLKACMDRIGKPNHEFKSSNSTGYDYYYELAPKNGEPRYAHISTSTEYGRIIDAYVCTPESRDYDNPLVRFEKPAG